MTKLKRGEKLRCTAALRDRPGRDIIKGSHTQVDTGVCFLCHFKGISAGQALGGCPGCHGTPTKVVEHSGFMFSHESYLKLGVACRQCHIRVSEGDGKVPKTPIATTCHVGGSRRRATCWRSIAHQHVTFQRHPVLSSATRGSARPGRAGETFEVQCDGCHKRLHNYQKEIVHGLRGEGVPTPRHGMFSARFRATGATPGRWRRRSPASRSPARASWPRSGRAA